MPLQIDVNFLPGYLNPSTRIVVDSDAKEWVALPRIALILGASDSMSSSDEVA